MHALQRHPSGYRRSFPRAGRGLTRPKRVFCEDASIHIRLARLDNLEIRREIVEQAEQLGELQRIP